MALTKNDLQAIDRLVEKRTKPLEQGLQAIDGLIEKRTKPLEQGLQAIDGLIEKRTKPLEQGLQAMNVLIEKKTKPLEIGILSLEKGQKRIEKKFDDLFNFLDREHSKLKTEVKIVQEHLHLPTLDF